MSTKARVATSLVLRIVKAVEIIAGEIYETHLSYGKFCRNHHVCRFKFEFCLALPDLYLEGDIHGEFATLFNS